MANATLKDYGAALEEEPVAAAAEFVGVEKAAWEVKVKKAQAALLLAVGSEYKDTVRDADTARTAWLALEQVFLGESKARRRATQTAWSDIGAKNGEGAQGTSEKVQGYFARVRRTAREMEQCGTKPKEGEVLDVALAGLHARHSVLRTVLESDSGATMATALPRLMKEEQSVWGQHEEEVAMYAGGGHGARGYRGGDQQGRGSQAPSGQRVYQHELPAQRGREGRGGAGRARAVAGWNGVLKPNIKCYYCHLFGHFQDQCPQQPQQWSGGESGARAFVAIEDEGDDMGFTFSAWGLNIPEKKEEDVMEEVDLRQFWGPEYRWEDNVPGMAEHEVVIEEEVAMTAESVGGGGVGREESGEGDSEEGQGGENPAAANPVVPAPAPLRRSSRERAAPSRPDMLAHGARHGQYDQAHLAGDFAWANL